MPWRLFDSALVRKAGKRVKCSPVGVDFAKVVSKLRVTIFNRTRMVNFESALAWVYWLGMREDHEPRRIEQVETCD